MELLEAERLIERQIGALIDGVAGCADRKRAVGGDAPGDIDCA